MKKIKFFNTLFSTCILVALLFITSCSPAPDQAAVDAFNNKEELSAGALLDKINNENEQNYLMEIISDKYSLSNRWEQVSDSTTHNKLSPKYLSDIIRKKRIEILNKMIEKNFKLIESTQDEQELLQLMKNEMELKNEKNSLLKETT